MVFVRYPSKEVYGRYQIQPGATSELIAEFWVQPPVQEVGKDFIATAVVLDQFGNEHITKNMVFRGQMPPEQKSDQPRPESLHLIFDSVEKEVAAVLKAELSRYQQCGRRVTGLGSVQTTYRNETFAGIGRDWREPDSPKNQSIVLDPDAARIDSDNADALQKFYDRLASEERQRFVWALRNRLWKNTEYAPVGYFILLVLHRVGHLSDVLLVAKGQLEGDKASGFSDLLRLLDGLLRFRHPEFSLEQLNEVGQFVDAVAEHTFGIRERLAAVRAYRLGRPQQS